MRLTAGFFFEAAFASDCLGALGVDALGQFAGGVAIIGNPLDVAGIIGWVSTCVVGITRACGWGGMGAGAGLEPE
jgi:hypothetical protein